MKIRSRFWAVAALAGLVAFAGCDADDDGDLDSADFAQSADAIEADLEDAADRTGDAIQRFGEDVETFFARWDEDADRVFEPAEFERWWNDANPFDDWDVNDNDQLDETEIDGVLYVEIDDLDTNDDGYVTRVEMREALFEALDDNDDGRIDREEWRDAHV